MHATAFPRISSTSAGLSDMMPTAPNFPCRSTFYKYLCEMEKMRHSSVVCYDAVYFLLRFSFPFVRFRLRETKTLIQRSIQTWVFGDLNPDRTGNSAQQSWKNDKREAENTLHVIYWAVLPAPSFSSGLKLQYNFLRTKHSTCTTSPGLHKLDESSRH